MDSVDNVSNSVSGGVSVWGGCIKQYFSSRLYLTLETCASSFGVNFAQALAAILPSGGNSDVIVFRAKEWRQEPLPHLICRS